MASDYIARLTGYQYNSQSTSMDAKLGKQLIHESLTIKAKPKLKEYNGTPLFGSYEMDNEGIVPPDEVVVFEKGVLKELLNDRTITHSTQKANGFSSGADVLEVTSSVTFNEKQLKEKLLEAARKQGLDYAVIIRDENGFGSLSTYKISVADGKEEKLRNTSFQRDGFKVLKRVLGTTAQNQALNITNNGFNNVGGGQGTLSLIVPQGILVEELEVKSFPVNSLKEEQYTPRPW
jgi:predicted Zn-dependent protease